METRDRPPTDRARKEPQFVRCIGGVFTLPPEVYESLRAASPSGLVFIRHDEDVFTISPTRFLDARKRQLHPSYRSPLFNAAVKVSVMVLGDVVQVMPTEWRTRKVKRSEVTV